MAITYLKKSPKTSSTDDTKTREIVENILKNVIDFSHRIGISRPKVSILSATEEVIESVPTSLEAADLTKLAEKENLNADVFGPLAFDNSISKKSASIKGI